MLVYKNLKLVEEKHFAMRALNNGNITQEEYDEKIKRLEPEIALNTQEALADAYEEARLQFKVIKEKVITDGDLKRNIASFIIDILRHDFTEDEMKGIFRQGYKIIRRGNNG